MLLYVLHNSTSPNSLYQPELEDEDGKLHNMMILAADVRPSDLEINDKFWLMDGNHETSAGIKGFLKRHKDSLPYQPAIDLLRTLTDTPTPLEKITVIQDTLQLISRCVKDYWKKRGRKEESSLAVGADDMLPLFVYVLIQAQLPHAYSEKRMMENFVPERLMMGSAGYSMATYQVL